MDGFEAWRRPEVDAVTAAEGIPRRAFVEQVMGLPISIHVRGPDARSPRTTELVADVFADLHHIDALFSTYRSDSQITRINSGTLTLADAHHLVREVHHLGDLAAERTGGLFSIHLPDTQATIRLDPSGIVKSWAAQRAFDRLETLGQDICLNAGGDVVVGTAAGGPPWQIGIEDPDGHGVIAVVHRCRGAVTTSGTRARGRHLIDPRDGSRPEALKQVTVLGPSLIWADILSTAAFVQGATATTWLAAHARCPNAAAYADIDVLPAQASADPGYQGLVVSAADLVRSTPGFWAACAPRRPLPGL